jgi:hypothetical protein
LAKLREADPNALHQPFTPPGAVRSSPASPRLKTGA